MTIPSHFIDLKKRQMWVKIGSILKTRCRLLERELSPGGLFYVYAIQRIFSSNSFFTHSSSSMRSCCCSIFYSPFFDCELLAHKRSDRLFMMSRLLKSFFLAAQWRTLRESWNFSKAMESDTFNSLLMPWNGKEMFWERQMSVLGLHFVQLIYCLIDEIYSACNMRNLKEILRL